MPIFVRKGRCSTINNDEGRLPPIFFKPYCQTCTLLSECTKNKDHKKLIQRHVWEQYLEEADHLRHTQENKNIYAKRKETIERVFADAKEKHGMRWTTLRGLIKLSMPVMLTFAAMNLKKMANWTWLSPCLA
jgi:hypothetical protein